MTKRGVKTWDDPPADLFTDVPEPAPPPVLAIVAPARPRYSDRDCRRLEKVLDLFKDWLFAAELKALKAADLAKLAKRFPPMQEWDIAEMIAHQVANYDRKDKIWRTWQRIR